MKRPSNICLLCAIVDNLISVLRSRVYQSSPNVSPQELWDQPGYDSTCILAWGPALTIQVKLYNCIPASANGSLAVLRPRDGLHLFEGTSADDARCAGSCVIVRATYPMP